MFSRCMGSLLKHTAIHAVEIVKIRREAQSLDCAFNVLVDVLSGVGDTAILKDSNATLGCH